MSEQAAVHGPSTITDQPASAGVAPERPGGESEALSAALSRQLATLDGLRVFIIGQTVSSTPLPLLNWSLGLHGYEVSAELPDGKGAIETLTAYAAAFGTEVHQREKPGRTVYSVRGVIGPRRNQRPRTRVLIRLTVRHGRSANGGAR